MTLSSTAVERAIAQCTSRWAMARGHRLNTSIVLAAVHGLSGLFRAVSAVEPFTLSPPSHSVPVPNRPTRLCGRKATLNLGTERATKQTTLARARTSHPGTVCDSDNRCGAIPLPPASSPSLSLLPHPQPPAPSTPTPLNHQVYCSMVISTTGL